jgi:putative ABC transport system ATP-binding protein
VPNLLIEARGLTRVLGSGRTARPVLDGVDLAVSEGELVAVVGRSGAGKSTLLHLLGGLDRPTSGALRVAGVDLADASERQLARFRRDRLGIVFQAFRLVPELSVLENALLPARLAGRTAEGRERLAGLLDRLGVADLADRLPVDLSGGEQQRVAIARALVLDPQVVLADEPTGNLDQQAGDRVLALLREVAADGRRAVVLVTHHAEHAAGADRMERLVDGRLGA